jgi:flagellar basal-body rod modification protein FlgD
MSIGPTSSVSSSGSSAANALSMQDFLKVLLTQLTYQDPLKPMDNQQFMAQIAQFSTLGQTQLLNERIAALVANQASLQSVGLIGRTVDFTANGSKLTGTVVALNLAGQTPVLSIRTTAGATISNVELGQIAEVR